MINGIDYSKCVVCKACADACPQKCISFDDEYKSFKYPTVNKDLCTNCGLCARVCPALNKTPKPESEQFFAAKAKDSQVLKNSSSGGIFYTIATDFTKAGGVVVASAFDKGLKLKHQLAFDDQALTQMRGSKYIQSDMQGIYKQIDKQLKQGKKVLFVGTACQTAAVSSYFKANQSIYLIDVICHSVVSSDVFDAYKDYLQKKNKSKIISYDFRNKQNGWKDYQTVAVFENGSRYISDYYQDLYMKCFLWNVNMRESCISCNFKDGNSASDLTLGDFWGIDEMYPSFYDYMGNSAVAVHTQKGKNLLESISNKLDLIEVPKQDVTKYNPSYLSSATPSPKRDEFFAMANKKGYVKAMSGIVYGTGISYLKYKIKTILKRILK